MSTVEAELSLPPRRAMAADESHLQTEKNETVLAEQPFGIYTLPPAGGRYVNPYDGITFEEIRTGKAYVKIIHVKSGLDFVVVNAAEKQSTELSDLVEDMSGWYNFQMKRKNRKYLPPPTLKLDKGVYIGYCKGTNTWNRVQILLDEKVGRKGMIKAFLCDEGVFKEIPADTIQFLRKEFCELPRQAFFAEAEFAKVGSPNYGQREMLQKKLQSAVGKTLEVNITNVLTTESIVPLLTVEFKFN